MLSSVKVEIQSNPPFPQGARLDIALSSRPLLDFGFVTPIFVQTPSILCAAPLSKPFKAILVMALFDTGASRTSISGVIAEALDLSPVGFSRTQTASGIDTFPDYAVDIHFPNADLRGYENLRVGSCNLPYNHNLPDDQRLEPTNFAVLIGRDMMAQWNVVWNGPTSSVFISE